MNIYQAIMKAADHIEAEPNDYNFTRFESPPACGSPACMLGWIGYYLGMPAGTHNNDVKTAIGLPILGVYDLLGDLAGSHEFTKSNKEAARALRLYAEKYHADKKPEKELPAEILAIFEPGDKAAA